MTPRTKTHKKKPYCREYCKKKHCGLVVGDSLLKGTEVPLCQSLERFDASWGTRPETLPGESPWEFVKSTDCYPLLFFHRGMNNSGSWNTVRMKKKPWKCKWRTEWSSLQFWQLEEREKNIHNAYKFLAVWLVPAQGFLWQWDFLWKYNLLRRDRIHQSRTGKAIFGSRLAKLMRWAFNWKTWGWGPKWQCSCHYNWLGKKAGQPEQWQIFCNSFLRREPEGQPLQKCV